jgi:acyl-CoA reductase-like NAD-dependent aldehyde dehydrogenase
VTQHLETAPAATAIAPLFVAGDWQTTERTIDVRAPYGGELVGRVSAADRKLAEAAIDAAEAALASGLALHRRIAILDRATALLQDAADELADLLVREAGKPVRQAEVEVARAASTFRFAAGEATRLSGEMVPIDATAHGAGRLAFTLREPIGIVGAITPFNFPLNLVAHKLAPAIAAGCPVVLKPASQTPLIALRVASILASAGLPDGFLSVLPGPGPELGDALVEDPRVRLITFTGSADVGWGLRARAATKRVALELGNNAPAVVAADADLEDAARRLAENAFSYAGQSCISVQRIYVEEPVFGAFLDAFLERVDRLRSGDPADPATHVGPVIDERECERIREWISEATAAGARRLAGRLVEPGVLSPTVLTDVPRDARVLCREVFGPVVCVDACESVRDGLNRANDTSYGLQAAIFTGSLQVALESARALRFGGVIVNDAPTFRSDQMPYGGIGESGNTREGPRYAIEQMTEPRLVVVSP